MINRVYSKSRDEITSEWDRLAEMRIEQIRSGLDITYNNFLMPIICRLAMAGRKNRVLDVGCGVGVLCEQLSSEFKKVVGVDPSKKSIEIAIREGSKKCDFYCDYIENFVNYCDIKYNVIIANMVLMDVLDISSFLESCRKLLMKDGIFIFSITHPGFWSRYRGYDDKEWFIYDEEIIIEAPFVISKNRSNELISTHIHRPFEDYVMALRDSGLYIDAILEPIPSVVSVHHIGEDWKYPRYLFGTCRKL